MIALLGGPLQAVLLTLNKIAMKTKVVNMTSMKVSTSQTEIDGKLVSRDLYLCESKCGKTFFTHEKIGCGVAVSLEERKAGDTYVDKDGTEKKVLKNGWNFRGVIGKASDISEITATENALKEMAQG